MPACRRRRGSGVSSCSTRNSTPTTTRSPAPARSAAASSPKNMPASSRRSMPAPPMSRSAPRSPTRTAARRRCARASSSAMSRSVQPPPRRGRAGQSRRRWRRSRVQEMPEFEWQFTLVLLTNGIMIGLMYALIALGFVLIYKATDAINFAQGEFVMFAGFIAAVAAEMVGAPFWLSALVAVAGMIALGFGLERVVLRPLIGRPVIAVVMATIGLAAVLRGTAVMAFGAGTRAIIMPVSDEPFELGPIMLPPVQLVGAGVSLVFLAAFTWFFLKSRTGIAMRAVADSQQVAMAMGINVRRYFALAWAMAGVVSALGGVVWGTMLGVDNQLALVGLKVFPVVILGGLDSIIGAVVGGLIVGIVENLAAGYLDPYVGGGTKDFAPYLLMIAALMVRPEGIFGRRRIERV